jgi:hypothetical protein
MNLIRWEHYPSVAGHPHARNWLEIQAICERTARPFTEATKADIAAYIDDMTHRPNPKGDTIRYLHSGAGLANSTVQPLSVVDNSISPSRLTILLELAYCIL